MESLFGQVEAYVGDPILSLYEAFTADHRSSKVNLGIGIYTDEAGTIPVLSAVARAHNRLPFLSRPYLPMEGHLGYREGVQRLIFGDEHPVLAEERIATIQTVGGTGGISIAADFLAKHCAGQSVYVGDPTWDATVLGDGELRGCWEEELTMMRDRLLLMRRVLASEIQSLSSAVDVEYLLNQRGMFSFTGLDREQIRRMRVDDGVYLIESGRMCVAGLTHENVSSVAVSLVKASI